MQKSEEGVQYPWKEAANVHKSRDTQYRKESSAVDAQTFLDTFMMVLDLPDVVQKPERKRPGAKKFLMLPKRTVREKLGTKLVFSFAISDRNKNQAYLWKQEIMVAPILWNSILENLKDTFCLYRNADLASQNRFQNQ